MVQAFGMPVPDASWFQEEKSKPAGTVHESSSDEEEELRSIYEKYVDEGCSMARNGSNLQNSNPETICEFERPNMEKQISLKRKSCTVLFLKRFKLSKSAIKQSLAKKFIPSLSLRGKDKEDKKKSLSASGKLRNSLRKRFSPTKRNTQQSEGDINEQLQEVERQLSSISLSPNNHDSNGLGMIDDHNDECRDQWNTSMRSSMPCMPVYEEDGEEEDDDDDDDDEEDEEEFHDAHEQSWFDVKQNQDVVAEPNHENSFHQKLKRSGSSSTHCKVKKVPAEAYSAKNYDYGSKDYGMPKRQGLSKNQSARNVDLTLPTSQSFDDDKSVSSIGIAKPAPLEKSANKDFILPTVVVGSTIFNQTVSSPKSAAHKIAASPTSVIVTPMSPMSPIHRSASTGSSTRRIRSIVAESRGSFSLDYGMLPKIPFGQDDAKSVCSEVSAFTHYSTGSKRLDSVGRILINIDDGSVGTDPSIPAYVTALEEKVINLERKLSQINQQSQRSLKLKDPNSSQLFVLLLEPIERKFEMVQVDADLSRVTVGEIVRMISKKSTVPLLANQMYRGLCRPKDGIEMCLPDTPAGKVPGGWRIVEGEILVAIPHNCTGRDCILMAQPILRNPKVVRLLRRKRPSGRQDRLTSY